MPVAEAVSFPIDLGRFQPMTLDPSHDSLTDDQRQRLASNIQFCRDVIIFFTAVAGAKGLAGHTGGPYDIVPEVMIADAFMRGNDANQTKVVPAYFDEAGHRVAIQYLMAVLNGELEAEKLLHYREYNSHLPGHPEKGFTPGVKFSSGRLGHIWPFCNGVAMAHPDQAVIVFGSDGSQMEGNDAEAARLAVANALNINLLVDDNDVTIAGHPSKYLPGFDISKTLQGHGLRVDTAEGEDLDALYRRMCMAVKTDGPVGLVNKRVMGQGIPEQEGTPEAHDVIKKDNALTYLKRRGGYDDAIAYLEAVEKNPSQPTYRGSTQKQEKNRSLFGKVLVGILEQMPADQRQETVRVFDNDLEGSTGIAAVREAFPEIFISGGVMERGNFSAAAGFGFDTPQTHPAQAASNGQAGGPRNERGRQGIYATFSAFLEMAVSEITMARLNHANVLAHYSHAGVDDMADNTCHFGINNMFADGGLPGTGEGHADNTRLYFPSDPHQFGACLKRIFNDGGLRFIFSNRSSIPYILDEAGNEFFSADNGYQFQPGKDEVIREAKDGAGYVVSFGETLYRALGAVDELRDEGLGVGLVNKSTLNVADEASLKTLGRSPFVLLAEAFNVRTGLGSRFGTWLLERGYSPRYAHIGTHKEGSGGLWRQMGYQGLDPESIKQRIRQLADA